MRAACGASAPLCCLRDAIALTVRCRRPLVVPQARRGPALMRSHVGESSHVTPVLRIAKALPAAFLCVCVHRAPRLRLLDRSVDRGVQSERQARAFE
jgi:hypothetical protein